MKKPTNWSYFQTLQEWTDWLEENFTQKEIWIEIQKKKSTKLGINLNDAVTEALCFGWIDGLMYSLDQNSFIIRMTPRQKKSPWSLINKQRALKLIAEGRMRAAGYKCIEQAKENGWWDKAYSSAHHNK